LRPVGKRRGKRQQKRRQHEPLLFSYGSEEFHESALLLSGIAGLR
jgi:hypothetical protein